MLAGGILRSRDLFFFVSAAEFLDLADVSDSFLHACATTWVYRAKAA